MKKLIVLGIAALIAFYGYPNQIMGLIGFGPARFGISSSDPLGSPKKLHTYLTGAGFTGDLGTEGKSRKLTYSKDEKDGWGTAITIDVGEEEYIQKITGAFPGTTHGYSPQRAGVTEVVMGELWKAAGGPKKLSYIKINDGSWSFPRTVKFGPGFKIPLNHMEATFENKDLKGRWAYEDRFPYDLVEIWLKG